MHDSSPPVKEDRPLVTFALFAYNQERFIREAVEGAFAQTYEPLEIILSDDCSTDRTFEIMQEMAAGYRGPHEVRVRRSPGNRGIASHFTDVVLESAGFITVVAAGDDISLPDRTKISVRVLNSDQKLSFMEVSYREFSDSEPSDRQLSPKRPEKVGRLTLANKFNGGPNTKGACRAFRTDDLKKFGPLQEDCRTEDTPSVIRLLCLGDGYVTSDCGAHLRRHAANLSLLSSRRLTDYGHLIGQYATDMKVAVDLGFVQQCTAEHIFASASRSVAYREAVHRLKIGGNEAFSTLTNLVKPGCPLSPRSRLKLFAVFLKHILSSSFRSKPRPGSLQ